MLSSLHIDHFDGVVAESGDEQPLTRGIEGQMVNAPFDTRKLDCSGQRQRLLRGGQLHRKHRACQRTHD